MKFIFCLLLFTNNLLAYEFSMTGSASQTIDNISECGKWGYGDLLIESIQNTEDMALENCDGELSRISEFKIMIKCIFNSTSMSFIENVYTTATYQCVNDNPLRERCLGLGLRWNGNHCTWPAP